MNYQNAKIYAIRSNQTNKIYIGSTCQPLSKRFYEHKMIRNECKSKILLDNYDDCYIELIKNCPCNSKEELRKIEGDEIRNNNNCINRYIAGRNMKEYYIDNIDKLKENNNDYYYKNIDKIKKQRKEKHKCECGKFYTILHKKRHEESSKHQEYLFNNDII